MPSNTLAALALLLIAVGIFGLLNYSVTRRTAEIGLRMALGAWREQVTQMTLREAVILILPGLALGLIAARVASLLYQTKPFDPAILALSVFVLVVAVGAGSYLPARRASKIEPMQALRAE